jgi:biofilm PGA synthesis N-glycosyltransferase PgaC
MRILRRGYRVLFEPGARAYDRVAATARQEFTRKARTIAGAFQLFTRERWLLDPRRNRLWLQTLSHKGVRLLTPVWLLAALGANILLSDRPFYFWVLVGQIGFYAAGLAGCLLRNSRRKIPFLAVPYVVCLLAWATVVGFLRFVTGRQSVTWQKAFS